MKFMLDDSPQTDVTFRTEVDEDGDLIVRANGHRLLFISSRSGDLHRMVTTDRTRKLLSGLVFDAGGCIAVPT